MMDSVRGNFPDPSGQGPEDNGWDEDEIGGELLPPPIGQEERRMQGHAHALWVTLLGNRAMPRLAEMALEHHPELMPLSVVIAVDPNATDPARETLINYVGHRLASDCSPAAPPRHLEDVAPGSVLARLIEPCAQTLKTRMPAAFQGDFVNLRQGTVLYRGIVLPFSEDGAAVSHLLGVVNWKETADPDTAGELQLQINQILADPGVPIPPASAPVPPGDLAIDGGALSSSPPASSRPLSSGPLGPPLFEGRPIHTGLRADDKLATPPLRPAGQPPAWAPVAPTRSAPLQPGWPAAGWRPSSPLPARQLSEWLAAARATAQAAAQARDRSRAALYAAIGRAHDFALAAAHVPDEFAALVVQAGLASQPRAPLIPLMKLVFGVDYDKTRLTEYATVLTHALRHGVPGGGCAAWLAAAEGGIKGIVARERQLRREDEPHPEPSTPAGPRPATARRLRALPPRPLATTPAQGEEFALLLVRRPGNGEVVVLGEVSDDAALIEKAARHLLD